MINLPTPPEEEEEEEEVQYDAPIDTGTWLPSLEASIVSTPTISDTIDEDAVYEADTDDIYNTGE